MKMNSCVIGALTTQHTLDIASLLSDVVTTPGKNGKSI